MNHPKAPAAKPGKSSAQCGALRKSSGPRFRTLRGRWGGDNGTSLIEFAVSVPVLFMLLIGFIQMCHALYSNFCISEAARDTARWASVRGSTSCTNAPGMSGCNATAAQIQSYAQSAGYPGVVSSSISVSTAWLSNSETTPATWSTCSGDDCNRPGNAVQIVVSYPFPYQIPFGPSNTFNFSSTAQMVIVQ
jgi:Flp pilus assembly protein TadG